jgi:membrane-bound lytic murein transglycosylase D
MAQFRISKRVLIWLGLTMLAIQGVQAEELFPVPPDVQHRVDFWIKIFSKYGRNQVIIHDMDHMNVIYDVVDLSEISGTRRSRFGKVDGARREIRAALQRLSQITGPSDTLKLSLREREIYSLWSFSDDPRKFGKAAANIHLQYGVRELFLKGLQRSGAYLDTMQTIFRQHDLPEDICYLPHVESAFNPRAYSKVGAAGIWQFTRSTGRLYLKIDYAIDERFDPYLATHAAARLMRHNHDELASWPLAITAYNHGKGGMLKAKKQIGSDDLGDIIESYDGRAFGFASKNFYSEFLAAREIAKNYRTYFGEVLLEMPEKHQIFEVPSFITLDALSRKFSLNKDIVAELNPALRRPILKSARRLPKGYKLRLPLQQNIDLTSLYDQVPAAEKHDEQVADRYYRVESGDNLGQIAREFNTTVETLMDLNDISNPRRLRVGQLLELPGAVKIAASAAPAAAPSAVPPVLIPSASVTTPAAEREEAQKPAPADVTTAAPADTMPRADLLILARGHARSDGTIYGPLAPDAAGHQPPAASDWRFEVDFVQPAGNTITVQPEETVGHLSEWLAISPQRLRALNGLGAGASLQVGRTINVDFSRTSAAEFHRRRLEFHRASQEDFFSNFRVDSTKSYTVRKGDTIWYLCNRVFDVPYWLLFRYNKGADLLSLQPGQTIVYPMLSPHSEGAVVNP